MTVDASPRCIRFDNVRMEECADALTLIHQALRRYADEVEQNLRQLDDAVLDERVRYGIETARRRSLALTEELWCLQSALAKAAAIYARAEADALALSQRLPGKILLDLPTRHLIPVKPFPQRLPVAAQPIARAAISAPEVVVEDWLAALVSAVPING